MRHPFRRIPGFHEARSPGLRLGAFMKRTIPRLAPGGLYENGMNERPTDPPHDDAASPAEALGPVWTILDELPAASASRTLAATTVEIAAVGSGVRSQPAGIWRSIADRIVSGWRGPAAIVAAALVAGIVAGRLSQPDAAPRLLDDLPLVQHLDLLREAGSAKFLEEVAARDPGVPPRLVVRAGPEAAARAAAACRAEIDSLAAMLATDADATTRSLARREAWAAMPLEEKVDLERAAREFARLSANERRSLAAVARALVDPSRPHLREAAVVWHQWLAVVRPEDRQEIVDAGADKRLEWIDWYASRFDGAGRPGPAFRPDPRARPGGDNRGWWQRPRGPEPPFRSDRPLPPAETPAPPR